MRIENELDASIYSVLQYTVPQHCTGPMGRCTKVWLTMSLGSLSNHFQVPTRLVSL